MDFVKATFILSVTMDFYTNCGESDIGGICYKVSKKLYSNSVCSVSIGTSKT